METGSANRAVVQTSMLHDLLNDLTAAESAKELFVEHHGRLEYRVGCSGRSYQAHQITDSYPGIFDGIIVGCSFPDVGFGTATFISDAWLLDSYFTSRTTVPWNQEQKRQVTGFARRRWTKSACSTDSGC